MVGLAKLAFHFCADSIPLGGASSRARVPQVLSRFPPTLGSVVLQAYTSATLPPCLANFIDEWKRPELLINNNPDVPMLELETAELFILKRFRTT